jgi:GNAT superfamily N-acetyltransferase
MMRIRAIGAADKESWLPLWAGYVRFYRRKMAPEVTEATFGRLVDPDRQPHGFLAESSDGRAIGLAHYLFRPTSWALADQCYLEDLFVDPAARGGGTGRALIQAVYEAADARGAAGVYWLTQEFNADGRALYDTLARRTSFIRYQR